MLHKDYVRESEPDNDENTFFNQVWSALVKTTIMFIGEIEFGDLPIDSNSWLSYCFLLWFVFLIIVVLMNLLNGLAVSDTGVCRAEAEIYTYKSQVELIAYTESVLLGDPFNFLANFPAWVWLRRLPSFRYVIQFTLVYILMKCLQS